jgi:hypothetical protein
MKNNSEELEKEINNFKYLILHIGKYLININEEVDKLNLSNNSKEIIQEILQSPKITDYFCNNEKVKENRSSLGIIKALNEMMFKVIIKSKNKKKLNKINPCSFNQSNFLTNSFFNGTDTELYLITNIIKNKILEIVKSCFEKKFNENNEDILNKKFNLNDKKNKFILINNHNVKMAKIKKRYNYSLNNKKDDFIMTNSKFVFSNNNHNKTILNNSNKKRIYLNKSNSCNNLQDYIPNKNSSLTLLKERNKSSNNIFINNKKNLYDNKIINKEKSLLPELNHFNRKKCIKFMPRKVPSLSSNLIELIQYNTKDNVKKIKNKQFLNDCLIDTFINLRKINYMDINKCYVDYSKNSILKDNFDVINLNNNNNKSSSYLDKKKYLYGFEYKNIYRYSFNGKLPINKHY